jgi:ketosteroid isomerase-like protein
MILRVDLAQSFIDAFNDGDVEAMIALMDPEVELHTMRGLRRGHEEARLALARKPGGVQPELALDQAHERQAPSDPECRVALDLVTRRWRWAEDGSPAGEPEEVAFLFEHRAGKVLSWRPFLDRAEGLRAGGFLD